jgi:Ras-related protein Rab-18
MVLYLVSNTQLTHTVYDVTNRDSFTSIEENWLKEALEYFPENDVIMMLVGNKIDLGNRAVTKQEGEAMARKNGMMFIETSAKNRIGVQEAFEELVNKVTFIIVIMIINR